MNWQDKTQVKKGDIGESLVDTYLKEKNFIPYSTNFNGAHPFDRLVASRDKKTIFIADVKTKAVRKWYPDTGINISNYNEYKYISLKYKINVFIFFVDEEKGKIYGNWLHKLDEKSEIQVRDKVIQYPMESNGIRYFHIEKMNVICDLTDESVAKLNEVTTKNINYVPECKRNNLQNSVSKQALTK
jgi:hypothetical protein